VAESVSFAYVDTVLSGLATANNYDRWLISQFAPFIGRQVIEVGSGIGTFARSLVGHTSLRGSRHTLSPGEGKGGSAMAVRCGGVRLSHTSSRMR
jgi:hypothetical protein